MKSNKIFFLATLLLLLILTACHHHRRIRAVEVNNENSSLKIEYCGEILFNESETAIEEISPGGFVKYRKDGKRLIAKCRAGGEVYYSISDDDIPEENYDDGTRDFIVSAVKEIALHYNH